MISYLETAKKTCPIEIYNRGLKSYLEGKVISYKDMILDFWRCYKVEDKQEVYLIQIPLLHLALSDKKTDLADKALVESSSCTCAYFQEFGICKHITAVCASLENEFSINLKKQKKSKPDLTSAVFDSILEVSAEKKVKQFLISLEDFLELGYNNTKFLKSFILDFKNNPKYKQTLDKIQAFILEKMEYYEYEKKVLKLVQPSLILDAKNWWKIWHKTMLKFSKQNQLVFFSQVWNSYLAGNLQDVKDQFKISLKSLKEEDKQDVFEFLKQQYEEEPSNWLDFVLMAEMQTWLEDNLNLLDPLFLLKAIEFFPDIREKAETHLLEQVKIWSDFLETGQNYQELAEVFKIWQNKLGGSTYCQEALEYIKQNHPKKKKLFREIEAN